MEFGIFESFDQSRGGAAGELLEARLRFAAEAERLGVGHYHVTEHHGTPLSVCPSPNLFIAALSQRTERMRIGALVNVLPSYDPFRLAEEIATLDQLTGGRLDFGVGSGVSPYELEIFGIEIAQAKPRYAETLEAVTSALRTGRMRHEGRLLRSYDAELSVLPVQRPYPPLWYASSNAATAEWAGRNAVNFVGRWNRGAITDIVRTYWDAWHSGTGERINGPVARPVAGIAGSVVIASSEQRARDLFGRANDLFCERLTHLWHRNGDHRVDAAFSTEASLASGAACVGTAEQVRDQVVHQIETSGANYFEMSIFFGDMSLDEGLYSLRAFMEHVAPAARAAAPG
ncbi:LLM class flavin-dependent oxidoreductase [Amycolatopsis alkalitolerans]|uniref:LLM class flavin-dependent oxidoreductase n=1 Tax=Amycolatopsis alkalitolerans TaxID=2547244 RepID=A0A5C4LVU2_9PSEU|nr:LLM class flavin-dependent oxidoreductase [Amycolatopsis alkalitolerans]TNC21895.1 LLM class flavin-dependent oxidoreductase [Amycolatopsis alkalitolerans]